LRYKNSLLTIQEDFMTQRIQIHGLHVATPMYQFIEEQVLPAVGIKSSEFWAGFGGIVKDLAPLNMALLANAIAFNWPWTNGIPPILAPCVMPKP